MLSCHWLSILIFSGWAPCRYYCVPSDLTNFLFVNDTQWNSKFILIWESYYSYFYYNHYLVLNIYIKKIVSHLQFLPYKHMQFLWFKKQLCMILVQITYDLQNYSIILKNHIVEILGSIWENSLQYAMLNLRSYVSDGSI